MKYEKIKLIYNDKLLYVLGALLGDGCLYHWKTNYYFVLLMGDERFTAKYADRVTSCTGIKSKNYINRSQNVWFVKCNNLWLYSLFKKIREDLGHLEELIKQNGECSALFFIEGFFDAEGCVKIIKEKVRRKTPKICLDITNTNFEILELVRKLLKEHLSIEARYSSQDKHLGKDGFMRKKVYHLRIYKKEFVKIFFENINTTKLKEEKMIYVENWLKLNKNVSTHSQNFSQLVAN